MNDDELNPTKEEVLRDIYTLIESSNKGDQNMGKLISNHSGKLDVLDVIKNKAITKENISNLLVHGIMPVESTKEYTILPLLKDAKSTLGIGVFKSAIESVKNGKVVLLKHDKYAVHSAIMSFAIGGVEYVNAATMVAKAQHNKPSTVLAYAVVGEIHRLMRNEKTKAKVYSNKTIKLAISSIFSRIVESVISKYNPTIARNKSSLVYLIYILKRWYIQYVFGEHGSRGLDESLEAYDKDIHKYRVGSVDIDNESMLELHLKYINKFLKGVGNSKDITERELFDLPFPYFYSIITFSNVEGSAKHEITREELPLDLRFLVSTIGSMVFFKNLTIMYNRTILGIFEKPEVIISLVLTTLCGSNNIIAKNNIFKEVIGKNNAASDIVATIKYLL